MKKRQLKTKQRLILILQRWMHCSINSGNFLNLFQFILINYDFYYLLLLTFIVKDVFYKNTGILFLFYHFIIFFYFTIFISFFLFYYFLSLFSYLFSFVLN